MKLITILATVGRIFFGVCLVIAAVFFIVGVIDELDVEEKIYNKGEKFGKWLKRMVGK